MATKRKQEKPKQNESVRESDFWVCLTTGVLIKELGRNRIIVVDGSKRVGWVRIDELKQWLDDNNRISMAINEWFKVSILKKK